MRYVEVENLSKSFPSRDGRLGRVHVLEDISFSVTEGELLGVFGPNGCGKTTLLSILGGIEPFATGRVSIAGVPPRNASIGLVPQNYWASLLPWKTVLDNAALPLQIRGMARAPRHACAQEVSESLGVSLPWNQYPDQLSGGQEQMLAVVRALVDSPQLFLLDEPFTSLDFDARVQIRERLEQIWLSSRTTTILITHTLDEALLLCDRLIVLSARPARILLDIACPWPRPRTEATYRNSSFLSARERVVEVTRRP